MRASGIEFSVLGPRTPPKFVDTTGLAAHMSYFFIYPLFIENKCKEGYQNIQPCLLNIPDQDVKVNSLIEKIRKNFPKMNIGEKVNLVDPDGKIIHRNSTIKQAKHALKVDSINGTHFYLSNKDDEFIKSYGSYFSQECCMINYTANYQLQPKPEQIQFNYYFEGVETVLTTSSVFSEDEQCQNHLEKMKLLLIQEIHKVFGVFLQKEKIGKLMVDVQGEQTELPDGINVYNTPGLTNRSYIKVIFADDKYTLPKLNKDSRFVMIFDNNYVEQNNLQAKNFKKIEYAKIRMMTLQAVYYKLFKKQAVTNEIIKCLYISDQILLPTDRFKTLEPYFFSQNGKSPQEAITLVGKIVTEKVLFYKKITEALHKEKPYTLNKKDLVFQNEEARYGVHERFTEVVRTTSEIGRSFSEQELELIYYYTSDVKVTILEGDEKIVQKIYLLLNKYLQDHTILYKTPEEIRSDEKYQYVFTMHQNMQKIDCQQAYVFRGINYDLNKKPGEIITFKNWLSTSKSPSVAAYFAMKTYDKPQIEYKYKDLTKQYTLLKIKSKRGKYIKDYSYHPSEEEVIMEPYTSLKVIKKEKDKMNFMVEFLVYELEELEEEKLAPCQTNFIVWIDPDKTEGNKYFQQNIQCLMESTVFVQLSNNSELSEWINLHKLQLTDSISNVVFISNMSRVDPKTNVRNHFAGIESLEIVRNSFPKKIVFPFCFYVHDLLKAQQNLCSKSVPVVANQLQIHSQKNGLMKFIANHISVSHLTNPEEYEFKETNSCGKGSCNIY